MGASITLRGTLDRWQQHGDTGWGRGTFTPTTGPGDRVTVVGTIRGARPGDAVELTGTHETHPKYGAQFKVTAGAVTIPDSVDGAVAWIAHHLPMLGKKRARAMLDHFGGLDAFWKVVESNPGRLAEVPGITAERAVEIQAVYATVKDTREHGSTLRGWGLTEGQISKCMMVFGRDLADVVEAIRANPYQLYERVPGFGWLTADAVARRTGIPMESPVRIRSALRHVLESHMSEHGHVFMVPIDFQVAVGELLSLSKLTVLDSIDIALAKGEIIRRGKRIYAAKIDAIEMLLADYIVRRGGLVYANRSDRKSNGGPAAGMGVEDLSSGGGVDPIST
jgi:exodeoxyribonuclease V alpha subunit